MCTSRSTCLFCSWYFCLHTLSYLCPQECSFSLHGKILLHCGGAHIRQLGLSCHHSCILGTALILDADGTNPIPALCDLSSTHHTQLLTCHTCFIFCCLVFVPKFSVEDLHASLLALASVCFPPVPRPVSISTS